MDKERILLEKMKELKRTINFLCLQMDNAIEHIDKKDSGMAKIILKEAQSDNRYTYK